jgi:hypothetical protein
MSGYSLYLQSGRLVNDMNIGSEHVIVRSTATISRGERRLGVRMHRIARDSEPIHASSSQPLRTSLNVANHVCFRFVSTKERDTSLRLVTRSVVVHARTHVMC